MLKTNQIYGESKLNIFKNYETKAAITDFAILLGGEVSNYTVNDSNLLRDRTGSYWTQKKEIGSYVHVVDEGGSDSIEYSFSQEIGCRPTLPFSLISDAVSNCISSNNGILTVEYGEYPQWAVKINGQNILENLYKSKLLKLTGKKYTTDSRKYEEINKGFSPKFLKEYEYKGMKFIRIVANFCGTFGKQQLSNGKEYKNGDVVWVVVSPITWLVEEDKNIALSEKVLFAGVKFDDLNPLYKGNFMIEYFLKEIITNKVDSHNNIDHPLTKQEQIDKLQIEINDKIKEIDSNKQELLKAKLRLKELKKKAKREKAKTKKLK